MATGSGRARAGSSNSLEDRLERIEDKLYGSNGESLLERIARIEVSLNGFIAAQEQKQRDAMAKLQIELQQSMKKTLEQQLALQSAQLENNKRAMSINIIGLWLTIALYILGNVVAKALGW